MQKQYSFQLKLTKIIYLLFFALILYKSNNAYISPDEAYSFLEYVFTGDLLNVGLANNHLLNNFLIYVTTLFSYTEFLIRLPNIIAGTIYLYSAYNFSKKSHTPLLVFCILSSPPYLIEYFSIGRGYGISVCLIIYGLLSLKSVESNHEEKIQRAGWFFILASYSIHISAIFFSVLIFLNLKVILESRNYKFYFNLILQSLLVLPIAYLIFNITALGKPVYGIENIGILELIFLGFGLIDLVLIGTTFSLYFGWIIYIPLILFKKFTKDEKLIILISYTSLALVYLLPAIFGKPLPTLRVLTPFLPGILLSIIFSILYILNNVKLITKAVAVYTISVILVFNLLINYNSKYYFDWVDEFDGTIAANFSNPKLDKCVFSEYTYGDKRAEYYRIKAMYVNEIYCDPFTLTIIKKGN
tara:strand:+ start:48728 stop:49969 length:1242 start_codon:yes stop_codon:yes gene_type:complete